MSWNGLKDWAAKHSSWIWATFLLAVGLYLIHRWPILGFPHSLGEFLLLAGGLTITVDPYIKRKLQREAAEDIFHHLLGLDLPIEIRETLRDFLLRNRHYRRSAIIEVTVNPLANGTEVEVIVTMRAEVVAVAETVYEQHISFEEAERGTILEASVTSTSHPEKSYTIANPQLDPVADEPMVYGWTGVKIKLKKDECLSSFVKFRMQKPTHDFWMLNFGIATIHPTVRINGNTGLMVTASKADQVNGNECIYRKVFVSGDHIQIRWKPNESN
jgi:hypothetical protein